MARHPAALRADLRRFYGIAFDDVRRGRVPLADACAIAADVLTIPTSATARAANGDERPWDLSEFLLAHLWQALTGEKHPALPKKIARANAEPKRQAAINRAKDRAAERARLIASGHIT